MTDPYVLLDRTRKTLSKDEIAEAAGKLLAHIRTAIKPPFNVQLTAFCERMIGSTVTHYSDADILKSLSWMIAATDRVDKITFGLDPEQFDKWIDVSECTSRPIPLGVQFYWCGLTTQDGRIRSILLQESLPENAQWGGFNEHENARRVTHIYIPFCPTVPIINSRPEAWSKKADQKSSFETVSQKPEAEVQSDPNVRQHLSEADLRAMGVPSFLFKQPQPANAHAELLERRKQLSEQLVEIDSVRANVEVKLSLIKLHLNSVY